ncbi:MULTISPECIES: DUF2971 domain-containing protein [Pseudoalteromonas]|uniref:DUF2971 domain-containing protein n=1 Tax=Pseudoalteromonas TaxID=53246 RepID=UPI0015822F02|nr:MULTISPECIES: DUF2971 domain-containing protein [Pseudoalteromonas]MDI4653185.1 DUF2971 domain-containing protein [Pseudoalteromonas shioyasakiensis]NUJ40425.1 DUF2971 domain-containing protein [Pseudoalteromonas sp. 0303]
MIYHYCRPEGFLNIVKSQKIWACDLKKMNDPAELVLGFSIIRDLWDTVFPEQKGTFKDNDIEHVRFFYVGTSFSKNKDLLSQWRSYAGDGCGVSIGFLENDLFKANSERHQVPVEHRKEVGSEYTVSKPRFKLEDVFYNKESFTNFIKDKMLSFRETNGVPFKKKDGEPTSLNHVLFYTELMEASCLLKSSFYEEEQEVRLFSSLWYEPLKVQSYSSPSDFDLRLDFRASSNGLIAYTPVRLIGYEHKAIKEVILGPKSESSIEEIQLFLRLNSFENCHVTKSAGKYR